MVVSGIAVSLSPLLPAIAPRAAARSGALGGQSWEPGSAGVGRIDGYAKATGAKLYASDYRAADLPGWPEETSHALLVRAANATHIFTGIDLSLLNRAAKPAVVVTAEELAKVRGRVPYFYGDDLFVTAGQTPLYLGQPVALLIFKTFDTYDQARQILLDEDVVTFGEETGPVEKPDFGSYRFTRVAGASADEPDIYSPWKDGWVRPGQAQETENAKQSAKHGAEIRAAMAADDPAQLVLNRDFQTQSVDPVFLEPECGLAWYDENRKNLELVLGVQSPHEAAASVAHLLGRARADFRPASINTQFTSIGGGFGGRDHSSFLLYVALAAMFFPGRPVRLAHNRYQQFQAGIKQHAFKMRSTIAVDRTTGKIKAFAADHVTDGGGRANLSASVASVAATGAIGIYDIPKVDITTVAKHSRGVTAGSMRGYGALQTMTALEVLIDETASGLNLDPIEFRRRNALKASGRTMTGNNYDVAIRTPEILDKLEQHPIWKRRGDGRDRSPQSEIMTGTGVACVTKNYGSGADCSLARVEIDPAGKITVHSDAVEMGNGIGTALANRVADALGNPAGDVRTADVEAFDVLDLVTSGDPFNMDQSAQDIAQRNTRWVPAISSPTRASIGAHIQTHAAAEAARIIFRFGLWPAALALWQLDTNDARAKDWSAAQWKEGQLTLPGLAPLALDALAAKAYTLNGVTAAVAHGFNRWKWSHATFTIDGQPWTADIDALAVRKGSGRLLSLARSNVSYPPTYFNRAGSTYTSLCGTVVRVEIERATGVLRVAEAYTVLECGKPLVPEVVLGQTQGGFAMGVGFALFEDLPMYEDGPGNGQWNLGQYRIARGSDLPLNKLAFEVLPPLESEPPKGMAEVVMIPVVPAILNAISDATRHRFQSLPVSQSMLKGALS